MAHPLAEFKPVPPHVAEAWSNSLDNAAQANDPTTALGQARFRQAVQEMARPVRVERLRDVVAHFGGRLVGNESRAVTVQTLVQVWTDRTRGQVAP
jgi:hypothetical protein